MKYKIADLVVSYTPKYEMLRQRSEKYKVSDETEHEYELFVDHEHIEREQAKDREISDELAEYMVMGTTFYKTLLNYKGCLVHSSCVVVNDEAYLFSAPCGTGKSTHTSLWLEYLKNEKPYILNDDKPAIRICDDGIYAYGTPFSGKNDISENKKVKVKGICFLSRSEKNVIQRIKPYDAVNLILEQTIRKLSKDEMIKLLDIIEVILNDVPLYIFECNMTEEAVRMSYNAMKGENTNET